MHHLPERERRGLRTGPIGRFWIYTQFKGTLWLEKAQALIERRISSLCLSHKHTLSLALSRQVDHF